MPPRRNDIAELEQDTSRSDIPCKIVDKQLGPSEWEASVYMNNKLCARSTNTNRQSARNDAAELARPMVDAVRPLKKRG